MIISKMNDGKRFMFLGERTVKRSLKLWKLNLIFMLKKMRESLHPYKVSKYIDRDFEYIRGDWVNLDGVSR